MVKRSLEQHSPVSLGEIEALSTLCLSGCLTAPQQGREEGQLLAAPGMRSQRRNPEPSDHQHFTPSEHTLQGREQPAMATRLEAPGHPLLGASTFCLWLQFEASWPQNTPRQSERDLIMLHRVLEKPATAERVYMENKWQWTQWEQEFIRNKNVHNMKKAFLQELRANGVVQAASPRGCTTDWAATHCPTPPQMKRTVCRFCSYGSPCLLYSYLLQH